jgi:hypothetical protein
LRDFGLTWNQALEAGGMLVGNDVRISLSTRFVQEQDDARRAPRRMRRLAP